MEQMIIFGCPNFVDERVWKKYDRYDQLVSIYNNTSESLPVEIKAFIDAVKVTITDACTFALMMLDIYDSCSRTIHEYYGEGILLHDSFASDKLNKLGSLLFKHCGSLRSS